MKGLKTIISLGLIAITLASCGNSGKQAKSGETAKQETVPATPSKTYREIAIEVVSDAIALKKITMNVFMDYGVNWELFEKGEKVYDENNELARFHIIDMVLAQRQQFYINNNMFKITQERLDNMSNKAKSLEGIANNTHISKADLDSIGIKADTFIRYFFHTVTNPSDTRTNYLISGAQLYQDLDKAINQTGEIAQEAAPQGEAIYNDVVPSNIKQYWDDFLIPYLTKRK